MHLDAGMQGSWMHRLKSQQGPGKACRGSSPTCLMHKPSEMAMTSIESSSGSSISCDASCGAKDSTSLRQTLLGTLLGPTVSGTWLLSNRQGHSRRRQCHQRQLPCGHQSPWGPAPGQPHHGQPAGNVPAWLSGQTHCSTVTSHVDRALEMRSLRAQALFIMHCAVSHNATQAVDQKPSAAK